jgi:hypothetical protein
MIGAAATIAVLVIALTQTIIIVVMENANMEQVCTRNLVAIVDSTGII